MTDPVRELAIRIREARKKGRIDEAFSAVDEAISVCRAQGIRRGLADALRTRAEMERGRDGQAAVSFYEEAVAVCRELDDPLLLAHTVRHLGDVLQHLERLDEAEPHYREALALYRTHPQPGRLDLANAVRPMAILKAAKGEMAEATRLWKEARDLYAEVGIREGVAEAESHLARLSGS